MNVFNIQHSSDTDIEKLKEIYNTGENHKKIESNGKSFIKFKLNTNKPENNSIISKFYEKYDENRFLLLSDPEKHIKKDYIENDNMIYFEDTVIGYDYDGVIHYLVSTPDERKQRHPLSHDKSGQNHSPKHNKIGNLFMKDFLLSIKNDPSKNFIISSNPNITEDFEIKEGGNIKKFKIIKNTDYMKKIDRLKNNNIEVFFDDSQKVIEEIYKEKKKQDNKLEDLYKLFKTFPESRKDFLNHNYNPPGTYNHTLVDINFNDKPIKILSYNILWKLSLSGEDNIEKLNKTYDIIKEKLDNDYDFIALQEYCIGSCEKNATLQKETGYPGFFDDIDSEFNSFSKYLKKKPSRNNIEYYKNKFKDIHIDGTKNNSEMMYLIYNSDKYMISDSLTIKGSCDHVKSKNPKYPNRPFIAIFLKNKINYQNVIFINVHLNSSDMDENLVRSIANINTYFEEDHIKFMKKSRVIAAGDFNNSQIKNITKPGEYKKNIEKFNKKNGSINSNYGVKLFNSINECNILVENYYEPSKPSLILYNINNDSGTFGNKVLDHVLDSYGLQINKTVISESESDHKAVSVELMPTNTIPFKILEKINPNLK